MILRRIVDAFRRQDWFTVFVETMIVVLGVFLGLQVNNWNAARSERAKEAFAIRRFAQRFSGAGFFRQPRRVLASPRAGRLAGHRRGAERLSPRP